EERRHWPAVDVVVARVVERSGPDWRQEWRGAEGAAKERVFLQVGQQMEEVCTERAVRGEGMVPNPRWEMVLHLVIAVRCHAHLPYVVGALDPRRGLADLLHRRQ